MKITLDAGKKDLIIYYTIDGTNPSQKSSRYVGPFTLSKSDTVKAVAYLSEVSAGDVFSKYFVVHLATGQPVKLSKSPSIKYAPLNGAQVLVNGISGSKSFSDGQWAGFEGQEVEVLVKLNVQKDIHWVSINFYNQPASWIHPSFPELWISNDGVNFTKIERAHLNVEKTSHLVPAVFKVDSKTSFIKMIIPKVIIPAHAVGEGQPAWVFIDELVVE